MHFAYVTGRMMLQRGCEIFKKLASDYHVTLLPKEGKCKESDYDAYVLHSALDSRKMNKDGKWESSGALRVSAVCMQCTRSLDQ